MSARRRHDPSRPAPAPVFAALGDERRLSLLARLRDRSPQSIAELTAGTDVTRQAITRHLRVLESAGLVRSSRSGRRSLFDFEPAPIRGLQGYLERVSAHWDQSLARLKAFVEQ